MLLRTLRALVRPPATVPLGEESSVERFVSPSNVSDGADPCHQHEVEPGDVFSQLHHSLFER